MNQRVLFFLYLRFRREVGIGQFNLQLFVVVSLLLGLAIGYIMIIVLLLHEGVDHALQAGV